MKTVLCPKPLFATARGIDPALLECRAHELTGMTQLAVSEWFPDLPPAVCEKEMERAALEKLMDAKVTGAEIQVVVSLDGFCAFESVYAALVKTACRYLVEKTETCPVIVCTPCEERAHRAGKEKVEQLLGSPVVFGNPDRGTNAIYIGCSDPYHSTKLGLEEFAEENPAVNILYGLYLLAGPQGPYGIEGGSSLKELLTAAAPRVQDNEQRIMNALEGMPECIVILDMAEPLANALCAGVSFRRYFESRAGEKIRALIHHYGCLGLPAAVYSRQVPTIVVNWEQADFWDKDTGYMDAALTNKTLEASLDAAKKMTKTEHILIFNGAEGGCHVSESLAAYLQDRA